MSVKTEIAAAVREGAKIAADKTTTDMKPKDVATVTQTVLTELKPVIEHVTNNEPWYQSRVTWGALAAIALPLLGAFGVSTDVIDSDQFVALGLAVGTAAGGVLTLYGRWKAKKPIGS